MGKAFWDLDDTSKHWDIERQLKGMLEGSYRAYNGVYPNSVENIKINSDGTADVDLFGKDEHDESGHYHFHLKLYEDGTFDIRDCHKK
jgi:hypothetical protein